MKRASDNLVKAAQKAAAFNDHEEENIVVKNRMVGGIAQVSEWIEINNKYCWTNKPKDSH